MISPKLRFSEFTDSYTESCLNEYLSEQKARNKELLYSREDVLSVSGDVGIVNQIEYMGKSMAGADLSNYHIVFPNNIVYTKSPLKLNPYGIIKHNSGPTGIVSTLYAVYECNDDALAPYIDYYFSYDNRANKYLKPLVNIGAKHDMKVNNNDALTGEINFAPTIREQQKIVDFLQLYDEKINVQIKKIDALELRKKGYIQRIFSQICKFKNESGVEYDKWDSVIMEDLFNPVSDKKHPEETVLTIVQGQGTIPRDDADRTIAYNKESLSSYKKVLKDDFIMHLRSFEGGLEIATCEGIVSPAYTIFRSKIEIFPAFYRYYFRSYDFIVKKLSGITEGIRDGRSINMDDFWLLEIPYPSLEEQKKIGGFLSLLDEQIQNEKKKLNSMKNLKKGLLQQLFV